MNKNLIWIIGGIVVLGGFLIWLFMASSKPLPGQKIDDLGRGHVQIGTEVVYNSNPPTSGKHYEDWVRAGIYDSERDDRNLVHSMEHGYVIMHYRCHPEEQSDEGSLTNVSSTSNELRDSSPSAQNDNSEKLQCDERKNQLTKIYESKGKHKLIVIPRPSLDSNFALTAWHYLDKFDQFDESRIEKFIDAHLNMGPEKTME